MIQAIFALGQVGITLDSNFAFTENDDENDVEAQNIEIDFIVRF